MSRYSGILFIVFLCCACSPSGVPTSTATAPAMTLTAATSPPATLTDTPTRTAGPPSPTTAPSATVEPAVPTPAALKICSPLAGVEPADLPGRITNPFFPPSPGSDDPHQGIDLADFLPGTRVAVGGLAVQAVLPGRVAMVLADSFPYGNAVMIETPLDTAGLDISGLPPPFTGPAPHTNLTCPGVTEFAWDSGRRSIYLLYAHLAAQPLVSPGDPAECGMPLGQVGDSGNALNPHLHLETRVGPAGAEFLEMGHYDPSASPAAMDAYCAWRVSGYFQLIDPMELLKLED